MLSLRTKLRLRRAIKNTGNAVAGAAAVGLLKLLRLANPDTLANFGGWLARTIAPLFKENQIGRENLTLAFPEKSPQEIETILRGVWDNLGRSGAEFAQLDRLWDYDVDHPEKKSRVEFRPIDTERFNTLRDDGKPALIFAAHLANWELPAICAATHHLDSAVLYRRPNIPAIDKWLRETRSASMGNLIATGLDAPIKISNALKNGAHVGMLVDQYFLRGVEVTFFGRKTMANPLLARLAQHYDCPIHGTRIVRLPGNRFRAEFTEEIKPARDETGKIDIAATTQIITNVIEGWIRENPEQWLWLHRRWRPEDQIKTGAPGSL
ncbi:MAG: lipid A biosynthesis lauroyl acyltransferase [Pseudolabrys sp.]|nr:lipid A biosynthesis lauroyl acyltransferase [Pseudolabrys sp.]